VNLDLNYPTEGSLLVSGIASTRSFNENENYHE
jgi:hypothetical protein